MKILICDDQAIIREGLELLIKLEKDMEVVGLAQNGEEALTIAAKRPPDLALMDLKMPGMNGVEATRRLRAQYPALKILVLTTFEDDEWVMDAIRAGASGYLLKDTPREKVIEAIRGTLAGKTYIDPQVGAKVFNQITGAQSLPAPMVLDKLTEREQSVLRLLARGLSNAEIADTLHLSDGTVRNHLSTIFSKLDVQDRTQAVIVAIRHGLDK